MSQRALIGLAVAVTVTLALLFGYYSFTLEVAQIRARQQPGAAVCRTLLEEAAALVAAARAAERDDDPCVAEKAAATAVEKMAAAQRGCRPHVERDPMLATDAAIARIDERRAQLGARCRTEP